MGQKRKARQHHRKKQNEKGGNSAKNNDGSGNQSKRELDEGYMHYASDEEDNDEKMQGVSATGEDVILDESSDGSDMEDDDEDNGAEIALGEKQDGESDVEVTLDFYDPREDDVQALSNFLTSWTHMIGQGVNGDGISRAVCAQTRVGTTVRVEDDEAPVGFISCLNVRKHAKLLNGVRKKCMTKIKSTNDKGFKKILDSCMEGKGRFEQEKMGLILTERVVNMPPAVIPKLLEAIFCEIEWAVEDEPTEELREEYRFGWYLYITEAFVGSALESMETQTTDKTNTTNKTKRRKKDSATTSSNGDNEDTERIGFVKVEDEAWFKYATHKLMWDVAPPQQTQETGPLEQQAGGGRKAIALIISSKHVPDVRKMVDQLVGSVLSDGTEDDVGATDNADD